MKNVLLLVLVMGVPAVAKAQPPEGSSGQFLALDLAAGWSSGSRPPGSGFDDSGSEIVFKGWDVDGAVRFYRSWLGIAGMFSHADAADHVLTQIAAGPRVSSPFAIGGFRFFGHALAGAARMQRPDDTSDMGPIIHAGGGVDFLFFGRFQIGYVRQDLPGLAKNDLRIVIGGVVPLCLRECRNYAIDGIPLRRPR